MVLFHLLWFLLGNVPSFLPRLLAVALFGGKIQRLLRLRGNSLTGGPGPQLSALSAAKRHVLEPVGGYAVGVFEGTANDEGVVSATEPLFMWPGGLPRGCGLGPRGHPDRQEPERD